MTKKPPPFKAALSFQNRTIAHFYSQIEQQKKALQRVHSVIPAAIAQHALHCVVNGKKLLIYTDTAAWASQLRFYNSAILAAIAPVTREPISIMQIRVRTEVTTVKSPHGRMPNIPSTEKIAFIQNYSLTVSDEQLKLALQRLSATLAKRSSMQLV